jgi:Ca-activated chloride channel family protein
MRFQYPLVVALAVVAALVLLLVYVRSARRRSRILAGAGLTTTRPRRDAWRRHLPQALFLTAATLLLLAAGRPEAPLSLARSNGTVVLAFDVSNSMKATDVEPTRLGAAQAAAKDFVDAQPDGVSFGIVAFDDGALLTQQPTTDHAATNAAIQRLRVNGGTSLTQAILASLTVVVGKTVTLPREGEPEPELGYFGNATIVLLSDGDDNTGGETAVTAAGLAAKAGVRIETVGVGTVDGATVEVDGVQRATALNEDLLTQIAQTTAAGYHRAENAQALHDVYQNLDLRLTVQRKPVELSGAAAALAVLLLTIGGILMTTWFGRIL